MRPTEELERFGDGVKDASPAIQKAIDDSYYESIKGKLFSGGAEWTRSNVTARPIILPSGDYRCHSPLYLWPNVSLIGFAVDSTLLRYEPIEGSDAKRLHESVPSPSEGSLNPFVFVVGNDDRNKIVTKDRQISGLTILCRGNSAGLALCERNLNTRIQNVHFHSFGFKAQTSWGIVTPHRAPILYDERVPSQQVDGWTTNLFVTHCFFEGGAGGMQVLFNSGTITGNQFWRVPRGIHVTDSQAGIIAHNIFEYPKSYGKGIEAIVEFRTESIDRSNNVVRNYE